MSQKEKLLQHFKSNPSITQLEATLQYGILRLSERIRELEANGYIFERSQAKSATAQGEIGRYTRYHFKGKPKKKPVQADMFGGMV